ncbi:MAG TPA: BMP family ABC transporter substrate-binding protein [Segeticoccus sp.]|nr:BMP family ABC transporter substrate-binding protein [Segeticoccus sp.]
MRSVMKVATAVALVGLTATACGSKPASSGSTGSGETGAAPSAASTSGSTGGATGGSASGNALEACMVLDTGGVDDRSFNQSSWAGMQAAHEANSNIKISYVSSGSQNDYVPNLNAEVNKGCETILAVGGLMADAVKKVSKQNPDSHFAEIDAPSSGKNVYGLQYNTAQAAFLGGYLAAGMTESGKVATWGGLNIPPVTIYMDGFWEGVQYHNKKKGTNVQVLGWNEKNQKGGTFSQSFTDQNKGRSITQAFMQQGADIVFPVAGSAGLGAGAAAKASGGKLNLMWVDTDGCKSAPQYCQYFVTSVTKGITTSVQEYLQKSADGDFPTGNYVGTLENDGVGLSPYHEFDSKVPADLKKEIDQIKSDIIAGKIKITSPAQPK